MKNCRIKELRTEKGVTQKEIATQTGISRSVISEYEAGKAEPTANVVIKLADFFDVSTDYLLGRSDDLGAVNSVPVVPQFSEEDREVLSLFHTLTPEYQAVALNTLRSWAGIPATGSSKKKA